MISLVDKIGFMLSFFALLKIKIKVTLVQALRLYTGRTAHRRSRGIALPFHDHDTGKAVRGQHHAPAALYPQERPGTHCTGGWAGPRAGLDRCEKSRPHRDSIPGPSSHSQSLYRLSYHGLIALLLLIVSVRPSQS